MCERAGVFRKANLGHAPRSSSQPPSPRGLFFKTGEVSAL
jgi:hypothetical protein